MNREEAIKTYQSLRDSIAEAENKAKELKKFIDEPEVKKWEPKKGGSYINNIGIFVRSAGTMWHVDYGVSFEKPDDARKAANYYRYIHRLYKLREELDNGRVTPFNGYEVVYNLTKKRWCSYAMIATSGLLFATRESANKAADIMNRDPDWKWWDKYYG